jgi:hypothetical protein
MRPLVAFIGALAFLAALAVILLHVTGNTVGVSARTIMWSVVGCIIVGALSFNWAISLGEAARKPDDRK